tara:strand:+ start:76 stop:723 length:648 start_codon:yes stop_codon:yes gene_type:complete
MTEVIKQSKSEKFLIGLLILLIIIIFYIFVILPNKCLFVKNYDPTKLNFSKPENISILNVGCGNVIIELYPDISPKAVERFKMLISAGEYDNVAFHRVVKDVLVQAGDLEFGKKNNLNYSYIGSGKSGYGTLNSEFSKKFIFKKGSVAMVKTSKKNTEDSQFFILLNDSPAFNERYTPIGKVLYGLEVLKKIKKNDKSDYVLRPDFINSFQLLIK